MDGSAGDHAVIGRQIPGGFTTKVAHLAVDAEMRRFCRDVAGDFFGLSFPAGEKHQKTLHGSGEWRADDE